MESYNEQAAALGPGDIPFLAMTLIVAAITLGLGVLIMADFKGGIDNTDANATIDYGIDALKTLGGWMDTIAIVVAAVIILGLVFMLFQAGVVGQ